MAISTSEIPGRHLQKHTATGAAAIALSAPAARPGQLISVTVHLDAAPVASEDLTITLNAVIGAAYDTVLLTLDLSTASATDLLWQPDSPLWLETGDSVDVAYTNTNTNTYGVQTTILEAL